MQETQETRVSSPGQDDPMEEKIATSGILVGFPGGSEGKASACSAGDLGSIPGSGRSPGEGNGILLQYSCLENSMDRNLVGYSSWCRKELDMTERLTLSLKDTLGF